MMRSPRRIPKIVFATDCEGLAVTDDNACQISAHVIPDGRRLFSQLSNFDDHVAYVRRRPNYNSGDTLRLILPFLKSYKLTLGEYAQLTQQQELHWVDGAKRNHAALRRERLPIFQVSVSYAPFATRVARGLGIRRGNVYCTSFAADQYHMHGREERRLRHIAETIVDLPNAPQLPSPLRGAYSSRPQNRAIRQMEDLIWAEMAEQLPCSRKILREVRAMGGWEKVHALQDILARTGIPTENLVYLGDSITDVEVLGKVRRSGGVSISFNGDEHATTSAQYRCWGRSALIAGLLVLILARKGRRQIATSNLKS